MQDELEARKNAGHQDMKAALPDVSFGGSINGGGGLAHATSEYRFVSLLPGWTECKAHRQQFAPGYWCSECRRETLLGKMQKPLPTITPKPTVPVFMSTDSAVRKLMPVATGCLKYFPDALLLVAWVSRAGNDKHNPGQPLHWAKEKSTDEADCEVRHMLDYLRGDAQDPGLEPLGDLGHLASKAWRALAHLQRACDKVRKASGR